LRASIYFVTALACPVYYLRFKRDEFNVFLHVIVPVLGALLHSLSQSTIDGEPNTSPAGAPTVKVPLTVNGAAVPDGAVVTP
jgi:hypothetical protein